MGEVKRYEFIGGEIRERAPGWSGGMVYDHDYLALERERDEAVRDLAEWAEKTRAELTRLRAVEKAANAFLDAYESQPSPAVVYARLELAEACGRKG